MNSGNTSSFSQKPGPIGVFDSGYGGLTVLNSLRKKLPQYDFLYLGDNARAPYGTRSFEVIYSYTKEAVTRLFEMGCHLVILACNTASAKALRAIQTNDLEQIDPNRRVLGIIRPTAEAIGSLTKSRHVGILATAGTISSQAYPTEIQQLHPDIAVTGVACPMWVPLVENNEYENDGADYFVQKYLHELMSLDPLIDTVILGCTHYPLLLPKIRQYAPQGVTIIPQEEYVASSLQDYLLRHPEIDAKCTKQGACSYITSEVASKFDATAEIFLHETISAERIFWGN